MIGGSNRVALIAVACLLLLNACSNSQPLQPKPIMPSTSQPLASISHKTIDLNGLWHFYAETAENPQHLPPLSNRNHWKPISVPNNWFSEGFDHAGKAWYQKNFFLNHRHQTNERYVLNFSGIDYLANVWLNGVYLGEHQGYFQQFEFDVSEHIRYYGANTLVVQVDSPLEDMSLGKSWSLHKKLLKGIFSHHDTRPGGAWSQRGQEKNTGGIWNDVSLSITRHSNVFNLQVRPQHIADNHWQLPIRADILAPHQNLDQVQLSWRLIPHNFDDAQTFSGQETIPLSTNQQSLSLDVAVAKPKRWWPIGHGEPNLYRLSLKLHHQQQLLDQFETVIGFRQVEFKGENRRWFINDQPLFLRGTNYIATQWLGDFKRADYARDVQLMTEANINTVRVHAHITGPAFYQLADEAGLMIWQDFPLQWGYADSAEFQREAVKQVQDMVEQLGNHVSIIQWSLHNEPPWDADWMKWMYDDYNPQQNKALDEALHANVLALDSTRPTQMYSPTREHPWLGWYSGHWLDYAKPTQASWVSEYGSQALPKLEHLKTIIPESQLWPQTDADWALWAYHNFQRKETFENAKIPQGDSIEAFIDNTQQYQARLIQLATESYRRQRNRPVTAIFQFMFVENWPSMNWGIVDYLRTPKPGYHALKQAYQPILPSIEWDRIQYAENEAIILGLWLINDSWDFLADTQLELSLWKNTHRLAAQRWVIDMPADDALKIDDYEIHLPSGQYQLKLRLKDGQNHILGENHYDFVVGETHD